VALFSRFVSRKPILLSLKVLTKCGVVSRLYTKRVSNEDWHWLVED